MLNPNAIGRFLGKIRNLGKDKRGVSAVEFAIIAPVMISAYLGGVEISNAIAFNRKVTLSARALSDLVAQTQTMTTGDVTAIFNAAKQVLYPYDSLTVKMTMSSIRVDGQGQMSVVWSRTQNGAVHQNSDASRLIPTELRLPNTAMAVSEVTYTYTPTFFSTVISSVNLNEVTIMRPRLVNIVCFEGQTVAQCSI